MENNTQLTTEELIENLAYAEAGLLLVKAQEKKGIKSKHSMLSSAQMKEICEEHANNAAHLPASEQEIIFTKAKIKALTIHKNSLLIDPITAEKRDEKALSKEDQLELLKTSLKRRILLSKLARISEAEDTAQFDYSFKTNPKALKKCHEKVRLIVAHIQEAHTK